MSAIYAVTLALATGGADNAAAATCLLQGDEETVRSALQAVPASEAAASAAAALDPALARCGLVDPTARDLVLGDIAERWYRDSRRAMDYRVTSVVLKSDPALVAELSRRSKTNWPVIDALANCTTSYASPSVQRLLDTKPGSRRERDQFSALAPAMARCTDNGAPVRFSRAQLRAGFAREFYRNYVASLPQIERDLAKSLRSN